MTRHNPIFFADCGQVDSSIPAKNKRNIRTQSLCRCVVQRRESCCDYAVSNPAADCIGHFMITESSARGDRQTVAASTNVLKIALETALSSQVRSGCHCTPTTKCAGESNSTASITPSTGETAVTRRLSPGTRIAWWWL